MKHHVSVSDHDVANGSSQNTHKTDGNRYSDAGFSFVFGSNGRS